MANASDLLAAYEVFELRCLRKALRLYELVDANSFELPVRGSVLKIAGSLAMPVAVLRALP